MKRNITTASLLAVICLLAACSGSEEKTASKNPVSDDRDSLYQLGRLANYNTVVFPKILALVETGDIITRCGSDLTSEILRRLNEKDKTFSHIGIVSIEQDTVFVYHSIGGEFNPDQKLKREKLWSFTHPDDNKAAGVFRLPLKPSQTKTLIAEVQRLYRIGVPFDLDFDWHTNDRLYCAEFVVKSLTKALGDTNYFHHTFIMGKEGVGVDDVTSNKNAVRLGKWDY
ncbi:MAG: YiiX/YebB-like N1pC/P60 family cysteine hydrolase [Chitinophagaceae bacterium]